MESRGKAILKLLERQQSSDPIYSVPTTRGKQDGPGTSRGCIADRHDKKKRKEKSSKKGVAVCETSRNSDVPEMVSADSPVAVADKDLIPETSYNLDIPEIMVSADSSVAVTDKDLIPETSCNLDVPEMVSADSPVAVTDKDLMPETSRNLNIPEMVSADSSVAVTDKDLIPETSCNSDVPEMVSADSSVAVTDKDLIPETSCNSVVPEMVSADSPVAVTDKDLMPETSCNSNIPEMVSADSPVAVTDKDLIPETSRNLNIPEMVSADSSVAVTDKDLIPETSCNSDVPEMVSADSSVAVTDKDLIPETSCNSDVPEMVSADSSVAVTDKDLIPETSCNSVVPEMISADSPVAVTDKDLMPETSCNSNIPEMVSADSPVAVTDKDLLPETSCNSNIPEMVSADSPVAVTDKDLLPETSCSSDVPEMVSADSLVAVTDKDLLPETSRNLNIPEMVSADSPVGVTNGDLLPEIHYDQDLQQCVDMFSGNSEDFMPVSPIYLNSVILLSNELDSVDQLGHELCTNITTPPANVCELGNLDQCEILLLDGNYTAQNGVVGSQEQFSEILGTVDTNEIILAEQNESDRERQGVKEDLSCDDTSYSREEELSQSYLEDGNQENLDPSYVPNTSDDSSDSGMEHEKVVSKSEAKKKFFPSANTKSIDNMQKCSTRNENTLPESNDQNDATVKKRKRRRNAAPDEWEKNVRKRCRVLGKEYINRKGNLVPSKRPKIENNCNNCRFKCSENISYERQLELCDEYWLLGDYDRQKSYLLTLVSEHDPLRSRKRKADSTRKKTTSREYTLTTKEGETHRVCLKFFCSTFSFSFRVIDIALQRKNTSGAYIGRDGRKGKPAPNATPVAGQEHVKHHIDSFPTMESHYCRKDSKRLYLSSDLNITEMYRLYKEKYCPEQNIIKPVSIGVYRSIFNKYDPRLSFFKPKKDQCSKCNNYYNSSDKSNIENEWEQHKTREKQAMEMKEEDKKEAETDTTKRAVTFDLQAILTIPYAGDSQIYYKRKLSVYNFTIYDTNGDGHCFLFDETNGSKGSAEVGTCLYKYLKELPENVKHVSSFSDTCGGQNRNKFITAAMLFAVTNLDNIHTIDLKYMEPGHSYLEADAMHATIERARKHKKIYTTREWGVLIESARKKPRPYKTQILSHMDILDLQHLANRILLNTTLSTEETTVQWMKIKWLRFQKETPHIVKFKYELSDLVEFQEIDIRGQVVTEKSKKRRRKSTHDKIVEQIKNWPGVPNTVPPKYRQRIPISQAKKKDLLSLLNSGIIPQEYDTFIKSLPSDKNSKDIVPWQGSDDAEDSAEDVA